MLKLINMLPFFENKDNQNTRQVLKFHSEVYQYFKLNLFFSFDLLDVSLMFEAMIFFSILAIKQLVKNMTLRYLEHFASLLVGTCIRVIQKICSFM